ncbi:hypothetical protein WAK64_18565 [Bacillus spongiae]|uniref:Uncharacterized protein n=1 Tax=Bacillus spongiae TaxID=2683610 RepID=A0ABU8HIS4_9BACI
MKRTIIFLVAIIIFIYISIYLYNQLLGAIPLLLLSILFFYLAYRERKKGKKKAEIPVN